MLSPEIRIIIDLLKTCFHSSFDDKLIHNEERIDWEAFIERANQHGVEGLIYNRLKTLSLLEAFPRRVCQLLEQRYYQYLAFNMRLLQEAEEIISEFERRHLSLLIMQGMALLENIYSSPGVRPLNDIDLMIKEGEEDAVRRLFKSMGYQPAKNYPWVYIKDGLVLDVHHDAVNTIRVRSRKYAITIPVHELWRDSGLLPNGGCKKSFCIEDILLTLCAHLQKHSYNRFIWFIDLGLLFQKYRDHINWDLLMEKALRYNLRKPLLMVLSQLKCVFCVKFPAEVWEHLSQIKTNPFERAVLRKLKEGREIGQVGELLFSFLPASPARSAAYLFESAFPRMDTMAQIYGVSSPPLIWLAYPMRFFHLALRGAKETARILKQ